MCDHTETTRQLFHGILGQAEKWSPYRQMVANVFEAYSTRALGVEQVNLIARAVECLPQDATLQDALTFYVRQKVLRARRSDSGERLYEVNF